MYRYHNNCLPVSFNGMFTPFTEPNRTLSYKIPRSVNSFVEQLPPSFLPRIWNSFDKKLKIEKSLPTFKRAIKDFLTSNYDTG